MNCINFLKSLYQALCFRLTPALVKQHYAAQIEAMAAQLAETLAIQQNKIVALNSQFEKRDQRYDQEVQQLQASHAQEIAALKKAHRKNIETNNFENIAKMLKMMNPEPTKQYQSYIENLVDIFKRFGDEQLEVLKEIIDLILADNRKAAQAAACNGKHFHRAEELIAPL